MDKVGLLNKRISEIAELKQKNYDCPEVDAWKRRVRETLANIFGEKSRNVVDFQKISFHPSVIPWGDDNDSLFNEAYQKGLNKSEAIIGSMIQDLEEFEDKVQPVQLYDKLSGLYPEILIKCGQLYTNKHYPEAVGMGYQVVKDRLRSLTSFENGSDAFGKGKLYIRGAAAPNVDKDFQAAVKFLLMSLDSFRNEKFHTSNATIADPNLAEHYLYLSSLAMTLLDQAEIRK